MGEKYKIGNRTVEVGESYWRAVYYEADPDGEYPAEVEIQEWVLRIVRVPNKRDKWSSSHRTKRAYFTRKIKSTTWVKKSKKHFDYGWVNNIHGLYKDWFTVDDKTEFRFSNTITAAIRREMAYIRGTNYYDSDYKEAALKKLNSKLKREIKKNV